MLAQQLKTWLDSLDIDSIQDDVLNQIEALLENKQKDIKSVKEKRREATIKEWEAKSKYFKQAITNVMTKTLDENLAILEGSYLDYAAIKHWIDWNVSRLDRLAEIVPLGRLQAGITEDSVKRAKLKLRKELNGFFYISYHFIGKEWSIHKIVKESAFLCNGLCTQAVLDEVESLIAKGKSRDESENTNKYEY